MTRPLRIEFSGALYHITSRGDRREDIYFNDDDRKQWLTVLGEVCERFGWIVHSYCQMTNHYHLLVETPKPNLSAGMRHLNGVYTQRFNRFHNISGHLFQGRYKAILVQSENYLLELARYIVLNPLRANMVKELSGWLWSSYPSMIGLTDAADWLARKTLLLQFNSDIGLAINQYIEFVMSGVNQKSLLGGKYQASILGDESFIDQIRKEHGNIYDKEVIAKERLVLPLGYFKSSYSSRNKAISVAYATGAYSMKEIGDFFGVHYSTVSRAVRAGKH